MSLIVLTCAAQTLTVNEFCTNNDTVIQNFFGDYSDWIEIKNNTAQTVNLRSYCLSDNPSNLHKWRFPTGSSILPGQLVMVWGENDDNPRPYNVADGLGEYHLSFGVKAEGEPIILSLYTGYVIVDQCGAIPLDDNISYGRIGAGLNWYYFLSPTPRAENTTQGYTALLSDPIANCESGWYADSLFVNFTTPDSGAQIRYTTNGEDPKETSPFWPEGIYLHNRNTEPNLLSLIPTVLPNHEGMDELDAWYPPTVSIPKIHTLKVRSFGPGALPSNTVTKTYMVGINLYDFPVVSVTMDPDDLFDPDEGIYVAGTNYDPSDFLTANFMQDWGRVGVAEWFDLQGSLIFEKKCEVEIHGTYSARAGEKSLRLKPHETTGELVFSYPFFGPDYLSQYQQILLRNTGNDLHWTLFRDNLTHSLLKEQGLDTSNFKPCIVFLNGEFWGIHTIQENVQEDYVANHFNIPLSELDVLESESHTLCGSDDDYDALLEFLQNNDEADPAVWQYLETRIDLNNLREYMAGEIYGGNDSWPSHNIRYWRKRVPYSPNAPYGHDGRYRWLVYDLDYCFGLRKHPCWSHETLWDATNPEEGWRTFLLRSLLNNPSFKNEFLNTIADRLNYNWQPAKVINQINQFASRYAASIPAHIERWNLPANYNEWLSNVDTLRTFALNRPNFLRSRIVAQFELADTAEVILQITPQEAGVIRANNRVDLAAGVYTYFQGVPVTMKAVLAPGWEIVSFGGQPTDSLAFNPVATQTIQLVAQMQVPKNLSIRKEGTNLLLSWDDIPDADGYSVEFATSPYAEAWDAIPSDSNQLIISEPGDKFFYRVKAVWDGADAKRSPSGKMDSIDTNNSDLHNKWR